MLSSTIEGSTGGGGLGPSLPPELNLKTPANHFDFGAIFPQLSELEEFHVCFKVRLYIF